MSLPVPRHPIRSSQASPWLSPQLFHISLPFFLLPCQALECAYICLREQKNLKVISVFLGRLFIHLTNILFGIYNELRKYRSSETSFKLAASNSEGLFQTENQQLPEIKFKSNCAYLSHKNVSFVSSILLAVVILRQYFHYQRRLEPSMPPSVVSLSFLGLGAWNPNYVKINLPRSSRMSTIRFNLLCWL